MPVIITKIVPPDYGWPIVAHCNICKETVIVWSAYACEPKHGGYFMLNGTCLDEVLHIKHNMYPQRPSLPWKTKEEKSSR